MDIPTINKPTRITKNSATAIDQIIANKLTQTQKLKLEYLYPIYRTIFQFLLQLKNIIFQKTRKK